jgi:hypothetical protein
MRIRIIQKPGVSSIDGIRLDRFELGAQYEVGTNVGSVLLAEGWAVPVAPDDSAHLIPFRPPRRTAGTPNLIDKTYPPASDPPAQAAADRPPHRGRRQKPRT